MNLGLEGRVALVAGGTSGLGLAVGQALAAEGCAVALGGRRIDVARAEAGQFSSGCGVELDIRNAESIDRAVEQVQEALGMIDIVVLNGGGPAPTPATDLDLDEARNAAELLLFGPIHLATRCLSAMRARGWGRILAVGSSAIQQPIPGLATSSMFRAGLANYLKLLAEEVASDGVTVNMVLPGRIATDRITQLDETRAKQVGRSPIEIKNESERSIPIGRYGQVGEFAAAAVFLCSEQAQYVTGEQLRVDGGMVRAL